MYLISDDHKRAVRPATEVVYCFQGEGLSRESLDGKSPTGVIKKEDVPAFLRGESVHVTGLTPLYD